MPQHLHIGKTVPTLHECSSVKSGSLKMH